MTAANARRVGRRVEAGVDVAVEMLTSGTTGPPKRIELTYSTLERVLLDAKYYERDRGTGARLRTGVAIVNSPLVHLGGLFRVLQCVNDGRSFALLERFTRRRLVRRGAPTSTEDGEPGAGRAADGARGRPRPRGAEQHPIGRLGHRAAVTRRRRRVPGEVRHPRARDVRRDRVRRWRRRVEPRRSRRVLGGQAGERGPRPRRFRAPHRGRGRRPGARRRRGRAAGGQGRTAGWGRRMDPHHRPGPHRRRRLPVDPRSGRPGDHPGWVQGPSRRRPSRARVAPRGAWRVGDRRRRRAARCGAGRGRRAARHRRRDHVRRTCWITSTAAWRPTSCPPRSASSTCCHEPTPGRSTCSACERSSSRSTPERRRTADAMDLRRTAPARDRRAGRRAASRVEPGARTRGARRTGP